MGAVRDFHADVLRVRPPVMCGASTAMAEVRRLCAAAAEHACTVLIRGESGTGKEVIAKTIHALSARRDRPFVAVDCTTLRDTLLESQLFGHERGAFTGAERATIGFVRAADGGTLFLDEIGDMDLTVQPRLLRCLQERAVTPLGGTRPVPVDVRVIAATHRDIGAMVREGRFREDLYYRLDVLRIEVPPLRERQGDAVLLARHFLERLSSENARGQCRFTRAAEEAIARYHWPGNVRELANAVERAYVLSNGPDVDVDALPPQIRQVHDGVDQFHEGLPTLAQAERNLIERALRLTGGNQTRAAQILGIERRRLYRKVRAYKLAPLGPTPGE